MTSDTPAISCQVHLLPGGHRLSPGLTMGLVGALLHGAMWPGSHTCEEPPISILGISSSEVILPVAVGNSGLAFL